MAVAEGTSPSNLPQSSNGRLDVIIVDRVAEACGLHPALNQAVLPDGQFILQDQFQELCVSEVVAGGLLQPNLQRLKQPREPELLEGGVHRIFHQRSFLCAPRRRVTRSQRGRHVYRRPVAEWGSGGWFGGNPWGLMGSLQSTLVRAAVPLI